MRGTYLTRSDPSRNMNRFYRMDVQPDLFGGWTLWREWGRLGRGGRLRLDPYRSEQDGHTALTDLVRQKMRRGYQKA
jgi:predicted DNA-binding WGR domain protein